MFACAFVGPRRLPRSKTMSAAHRFSSASNIEGNSERTFAVAPSRNVAPLLEIS
jgi:hypothetical protein